MIAIKVCGMKHNVAQVAALNPDYLGFIFYEKSPRHYTQETIVSLPKAIKKVGVFVNAPLDYIVVSVEKYKLNIIQLHGEESATYCRDLKQKFERSIDMNSISLWKVFGIKDQFDFSVLSEYELFVDAFLFDTKGKQKGGNGIAFNWKVLKEYPSKKPFILSGGIETSHISEIKKMKAQGLPIKAIDINSKFEIKPGLKDISAVKKIIKQLNY